jgi:hypothetical protein
VTISVPAMVINELDKHKDEYRVLRGFYSAFADEVVVGIEASGYSAWFVELLEGLGHRILIGDASERRFDSSRLKVIVATQPSRRG